eukprot:7331390-Lingulodinium_polyedra.AAC.1
MPMQSSTPSVEHVQYMRCAHVCTHVNVYLLNYCGRALIKQQHTETICIINSRNKLYSTDTFADNEKYAEGGWRTRAYTTTQPNVD